MFRPERRYFLLIRAESSSVQEATLPASENLSPLLRVKHLFSGLVVLFFMMTSIMMQICKGKLFRLRLFLSSSFHFCNFVLFVLIKKNCETSDISLPLFTIKIFTCWTFLLIGKLVNQLLHDKINHCFI